MLEIVHNLLRDQHCDTFRPDSDQPWNQESYSETRRVQGRSDMSPEQTANLGYVDDFQAKDKVVLKLHREVFVNGSSLIEELQ